MTTVLLCDSWDDDRPLIAELLKANPGWKVLTASTGGDVVEKLDAERVQVLVTDAVVPDMRPDELLGQVRKKHSRLPVVLVTPSGPDDAVVRALRLGAANYIARSMMARDLVRTVERVVSLWGRDTSPAKLLRRRTQATSTFRLDNDPDLFSPLANHVQDRVDEFPAFDPAATMQMGLGIEEALLNACIHGNLAIGSEMRDDDYEEYEKLIEQRRREEPYRDRRLTVVVDITQDEAQISVRDEGDGFDTSSVPDPTDPENLMKVSGRGLFLIRCFFDDVRFNDVGNEITMTKRASPAT